MTKIERRPKRNRESHKIQLSHKEASKPAENGKANTVASGLKVYSILRRTSSFFHHPSGLLLSLLPCLSLHDYLQDTNRISVPTSSVASFIMLLQ